MMQVKHRETADIIDKDKREHIVYLCTQTRAGNDTEKSKI